MGNNNWMRLRCAPHDPAHYRRLLITWAGELLAEVLEGEADGGIDLDGDESYALSVLNRFQNALAKVPPHGEEADVLAVAPLQGSPAEYALKVAEAIGGAAQHLLDRARLRLDPDGSAALRGMLALRQELLDIGGHPAVA